MAAQGDVAFPQEIYAMYCGDINQASAQKTVNALSIAMGGKVQHVHLLFQSAGGYVGDEVFLYNLFRSIPIELTLYNVGPSAWRLSSRTSGPGAGRPPTTPSL